MPRTFKPSNRDNPKKRKLRSIPHGFTKLPNWLLHAENLTAPEFRVAVAILSFFYGEDTDVIIKQRDIAELSNMSDRYVRSHIASLEKKIGMEVQRRVGRMTTFSRLPEDIISGTALPHLCKTPEVEFRAPRKPSSDPVREESKTFSLEETESDNHSTLDGTATGRASQSSVGLPSLDGKTINEDPGTPIPEFGLGVPVEPDDEWVPFGNPI